MAEKPQPVSVLYCGVCSLPPEYCEFGLGDIIFDHPWISSDILHDLLLFENQLPMRFLNGLYKQFVLGNISTGLDGGSNNHSQSFNELALNYFKNVGNTEKCSLTQDFTDTRHLVEFLALLHMPEYDKQWRFGDGQTAEKLDFTRCATATVLLAAGVKFQQGSEKCLFDVEFDKERGELKIPPLTVNDSTETFFRNLIAFEQSEYGFKYMTSYVILLDNWIDTPKDVDILIKYNIIRNELGNSEQVAELFNNIYKDFVNDPMEFYFVSICADLKGYKRGLWYKCKSKLERWFGILRNKYFGTPWSIISVIAASILLSHHNTDSVFCVSSLATTLIKFG